MDSLTAQRRDFKDAHVCFLFTDEEGQLCVLFGIHYRNVLSCFGGKSNLSETLLMTIIREYAEESYETIVPILDLVQLLQTRAQMVIQQYDTLYSCTCFVYLPDGFDLSAAQRAFMRERAKQPRDTREHWREMRGLASVRYSDLVSALRDTPPGSNPYLRLQGTHSRYGLRRGATWSWKVALERLIDPVIFHSSLTLR